MSQKRDDFRVHFPLFYRGYFCVDGEKWRIADISAKGVKAVYSGSRTAPPAAGNRVVAKVILPPLGERAVEGTILRVEKQAGTVIIRFAEDKGIANQDMMAIHRHLIQLAGSQSA